MIALENINVIRSGYRLFHNFSWQTDHHENWVIQGANGSGKTTLLELIAGHLHPTAGEVHYDFIKGTTWDDRHQERKGKIHYVPAHAILTFLGNYPDLFYQQRYYSIGDAPVPQVKDIFGNDLHNLHALSFPPSFNIESLLELEVTRLSNGQLKKVLILRNLVRQLPEVILFDHPFDGLDRTSRLELMRFIDHISEAYGIQVIMAGHHDQLPSVINRKLILHQCRILSSGPVSRSSANGSHVQAPKEAITSTSDAVVEMRGVSIRYGRREILKNVHWTIRRGDRWALTGRNGSGKTTLFSLIFADHPMAYSQEIYLFGKRRGTGESIWDIKRRINYLGPELLSYLNPRQMMLTTREYLASFPDREGNALDELIRFFDAKHFMSHPVKLLSSGQLQLMMLMSCFLSDRELLLLDEPFQFLDPGQRERVQEYLQRKLKKDVTLVLITHDEQDIAQWTEQTLAL